MIFVFNNNSSAKGNKGTLVADPRYSMDQEKSKQIERGLREDVSLTFREPYPQEQEIGLPRHKM